MSFVARLRCFLRNRHLPVRQPLGGFRCRECGEMGADLREVGFDCACVTLRRKPAATDRHQATHISAWTLKRN